MTPEQQVFDLVKKRQARLDIKVNYRDDWEVTYTQTALYYGEHEYKIREGYTCGAEGPTLNATLCKLAMILELNGVMP